jgi:3-hydroxyisobutyrate dehydrogenase
MTDLAFLGLGLMGRGIAANAAAAGLDVRVWNRTQQVADDLAAGSERIVAATGDAADAARGADVVAVMVSDDDASRDVWLGRGVLDAVAEDALAMDCSSLSPDWSRELADAAARRGVAFVASPVLGSTPQVQDGQLTVLVGGDEQYAGRVERVLGPSAARVTHVGSAADAALRKLVVNGWMAGQTALAAELVGRLQRSGLSRQAAADFLAGLPLASPVLEGFLQRMHDGDDEPRFPLRLMAKDARYLAEVTGRPLVDAVAEAWTAAEDEHPERDLTAYLRTVPTDG